MVPDIGEDGSSKKVPEDGGEGYRYTMSVSESEGREEGCVSKKRKL